MSKQVKNMQIAALKSEFGSTRDFVVMGINKLDNDANGALRTNLRKKKIRLRVVISGAEGPVQDSASRQPSTPSPAILRKLALPVASAVRPSSMPL